MITVHKITDVEKYCQNIDGIIFDLDDTLYSEKEYVRSGYHCIAEHFPQVTNMAEKLWRAFLEKKNAIDTVLEDEGLSQELFKDKCLALYREHFPKIALYDGVQEILQRFHDSGKQIGIITDGRPNGQWNKVKSLGLQKWIDKIIVTDELGGIEYRKPNLMAFTKMQEIFGLPFERMVYIGDNINKDFIAPEKLGMQSIYFKNTDGLYYRE